MRTFAFAGICAAAAAQFGTTGHYGNAFSGPRNMEHPHVDHMYGYDSVPTRKDLRYNPDVAANAQSAEYNRNDTKKTAIIT